MDLSTAAQQTAADNDGVTVLLNDRDGNPDLDSAGRRASVTVLGEYADKVRKTQEAQTRRMWKQRAGTFDPASVTQTNRIEVAAAAITGWTGVEDGGKALPFSTENAVRLLTAAPWILRQVEGAIESPSSFFAKASINS